jgi:hypothetical protein
VSTESYLRFTVSGVSGSIASAKVRLYASNGSADGPSVYSTTNSWTETGITWSNRPARTSGALDRRATVPDNAWTEWDVTSAVTGNGTYSFVLATASSDGVYWDSREATNKPVLVLTFAQAASPTQASTSMTGENPVLLGGFLLGGLWAWLASVAEIGTAS